MPKLEMISEVFAARLAELRGNRTKAEFARYLGIANPSTYFKYEAGRVPTLEILKAIAAKCEVSPEWLVGKEDYQMQVKTTLTSGWEERLCDWIKKYARATEVLVNIHGHDLQKAITPAFLVFAEEEKRLGEKKGRGAEK